MSWSLQMRNGDLTLGRASYGTVTGEDKLVQDLRSYILEEMGTDDMHPEFGSRLNGGRTAESAFAGAIGKEINDDFAILEVEVELRRIVQDFQARQLRRAKDDRLVFGKTTLTRGEILLGVSSLNVSAKADTLTIILNLNTATGTTVELGIELGQ